MAKLNAKDRKKVNKAEAVKGGFEPLKPGKYTAVLDDVETKVSGNGNAYWNCVFTKIQDMDGESKPGKQWYMLMLPADKMPEDYEKGQEKWDQYQSLSAGRIKAFFEAFGYDPDTDTDDMIGDRVVLQIGIQTIQQGNRAGEKTNRVNGVFPLPEDFDVDGDEDDEDDF